MTSLPHSAYLGSDISSIVWFTEVWQTTVATPCRSYSSAWPHKPEVPWQPLKMADRVSPKLLPGWQ